jgi:hypothetical protein
VERVPGHDGFGMGGERELWFSIFGRIGEPCARRRLKTLKVTGRRSLRIYRARVADEKGRCVTSSGQRHFCPKCATALWMYDPEWPDLVHPFASTIDTDLPTPPSKVHLMLRFKASWVEPDIGPRDQKFALYPKLSIEQWHKRRGLWIEQGAVGSD